VSLCQSEGQGWGKSILASLSLVKV